MQGDAYRTNGVSLNQTVFSTLAELPPGNMGHWNFDGNNPDGTLRQDKMWKVE